ncbi:metallophosphoesterase family protein [Limibacillus halophilus]
MFAKRSEDVSEGAQAAAPEKTRVYAVGDCHGRLDLLCALEEEILEDAEARPAERKVVVYLGDYVDRGPDSSGVIDHLTAAPLTGFESIHLLGNHEAMMLAFLRVGASAGLLWLTNGGEETLASYGLDVAALKQQPEPLERLREGLSAQLPDSHRDFLNGLKRWHREGDYFFVHAGLRPGRPLERQDPEDLIWIREPFLNSGEDHGCVVVHGHSPARQPVEKDNRIGIDTAAVYGGALTALVLEGASRRYLQVR